MYPILRVANLLTPLADGFHPVSPSRLHDLITSAQRSSPVSASVPSVADQAENLLYFQAPTLAHLIGLICKPTANSIPSNTSLIVLDALSSLVNYAYPRSFEARRTPKGNTGSFTKLGHIAHR